MTDAADSLPEDVPTLQAMLLAERAARLAAESEAKSRALQIEQLKYTIAKLRHQQFGQSSERGAILEQLELQLSELQADASEAAAVRIEDYAESLRGHRVLHLVGKGNKPAIMPLTVPVLRVLEACRGQRTAGPLILNGLASSLTVVSPSASRARIARRVGSARAAKVALRRSTAIVYNL